MWEIQGALDKLRIATDQKRVEGQTQADIARSRVEGSKDMQSLIRSLEKMVNTLNNSMRRSERQQPYMPYNGNVPVPGTEVPPAGQIKGDKTDGGAQAYCPNCGRPVNKYSNLCVCGKYLG